MPEGVFNADQRLVLVANTFKDVSLNMADFLREHDIDVVCVEYEAYASEERDIELVTTDAIRRPLADEPTGTGSDEGPEYRDLIFDVRDQIYPELVDILAIESPEDIQRSGTKQLAFASDDPEHPDTVRYGFNPQLETEGTVTVRLNVWGKDDEEKEQVRSVVAAYADELENYDLTDDYQSSWEFLVYEMRPGSSMEHENLVDELTSELIDLVEFYHPRFVEEVST